MSRNGAEGLQIGVAVAGGIVVMDLQVPGLTVQLRLTPKAADLLSSQITRAAIEAGAPQPIVRAIPPPQ